MKKIITFLLILLISQFIYAKDHNSLESGLIDDFTITTTVTVVDQAAPFVMISGKITHLGAGLAGVRVNLTGDMTGVFDTGPSGDYSFVVLAGGSYTITPSKTGYNFLPSSKTFVNILTDQTQNFETSVPTNTISGNITFNGSPLENVIVTLSGSKDAVDTTDSNGNYSFTVYSGGNYTVTPELQGYVFTPHDFSVNNISTNQVANFIATQGSYTISGFITYLGSGLSGVLVSLTGTSSASVTTDTTGAYSFNVDFGGTYTVTPTKSGYSFNPISRTFSNVQGNETQNFTASLAIPDAPQLSTPVNNSINVNTAVVLSWSAAPRAQTYNLQVSRNASFTNLVINRTNILSTSFSVIDLLPGVTYYWRVSATNNSGTSAWSSTWNFTTIQTLTTPPSLVTPVNNSINISLNPTLNWSSTLGADTYTLQVSTNSNFTSIVFQQDGITQNSAQVTGLLANTKYYWRVRASNSTTTTDWSQVWNFTTLPNVPVAPILLSPQNNITDVELNQTLRWNAVNEASSYNLQVSLDPNFNGLVASQAGLTNTNYTISGLNHSTKYYWRVNATNIAGNGPWSEVWNFTTMAPIPNPPTIISPTINETNVSRNPLLTWSSVAGASGYDLQVSIYSDFATYAINEINIVINAYQLSSLFPDRYYYWRVRSRNAAGVSAWVTGYFKTKPLILGPTLLEPANYSKITSVDAFFSWTPVTGATYYELILSKSSNFSSYIANPKNLTSPNFAIFGLDNSTTYFWKVRAIVNGEVGEWSDMFAFLTPSKIKGPTLVAPENDSYGHGTDITFYWKPIPDMDGYDLQVATDNTFTNVIATYVGIERTYQKVRDLMLNTTLYWRVRGYKGADNGEWSNYWKLRTGSTLIGQPIIIYPPNGKTNVSIDPVFKWEPVQNATSYEVIYSDDSTLINVTGNYVGIANTSLSLSGLKYKTQYYWKVLARNDNVIGQWSPVYTFITHEEGVGVKAIDVAPDKFMLEQNYPNPFNPSTNIIYSIKEPGFVTLIIYDIYGREIETLVKEHQNSGKYLVNWQPKNLPSGVYYYQLKTGNLTSVKKMLYIR